MKLWTISETPLPSYRASVEASGPYTPSNRKREGSADADAAGFFVCAGGVVSSSHSSGVGALLVWSPKGSLFMIMSGGVSTSSSMFEATRCASWRPTLFGGSDRA